MLPSAPLDLLHLSAVPGQRAPLSWLGIANRAGGVGQPFLPDVDHTRRFRLQQVSAAPPLTKP